MESKEYFEKIMQDYNQNGKGRSLRKYCKDEAVDYSNSHAADDHGRADKIINMKIWQRKQTYKTHLR